MTRRRQATGCNGQISYLAQKGEFDREALSSSSVV